MKHKEIIFFLNYITFILEKQYVSQYEQHLKVF